MGGKIKAISLFSFTRKGQRGGKRLDKACPHETRPRKKRGMGKRSFSR